MYHDNLPKKEFIWLLFDIDNGDPGSHHYVWWFETRKLARDHKRRHVKYDKAELVGPVKAKVGKIPKGALRGTRLAPPPKPELRAWFNG